MIAKTRWFVCSATQCDVQDRARWSRAAKLRGQKEMKTFPSQQPPKSAHTSHTRVEVGGVHPSDILGS